jgi:hypothetical protein
MENLEIKNEMVAPKGMLDKLVQINELVDLLGYTDERSIESWCKKNKVPLFHVGKKTYTIRNFIDLFITQKMEEYVKANYKNAEEILKAINEDDKTELSKLLDAPMDKAVSAKFKKKADSKAAADFMTKLKAA